MKKETVFLISMVIALLLAIPGYKFFTASDTVKQEDGIKFPDEQETSSLFDSKTDTTGGVSVVVTPINLFNGSPEWTFEMLLDTHSVNLEYDIVELSTLVDQN